jgi:hypothetical protein
VAGPVGNCRFYADNKTSGSKNMPSINILSYFHHFQRFTTFFPFILPYFPFSATVRTTFPAAVSINSNLKIY